MAGVNARTCQVETAGEPSLVQVKEIIDARLKNPRPLSAAAKFWQTKAGFTDEDSQKWSLVGQIPNRYRPWMRASNPAGYFTQRIVDAQKPSVAEKRQASSAATENAIPGITSKLAAASEHQKHVGIDRSFGKNVSSAIQSAGTTALKSVSTAARLAGNAASVIPGIGTVAAYGLQFTGSVGSALADGKNALAAAKTAAVSAALNSLPGGELTGALVKTVANVAKAGIDGQNMLKSARNEVIASAIGMIPSAEAQKVLQSAADAAIAGKNVLKGVERGAVDAALAQVPDQTARNAIKATLQGKSPADVVHAAGKDLLAKASGALPTGAAAALVQGITGKSPTEIHALASGINPPVRNMTTYTLQRAPTISPRPGTPRPSLVASVAPAMSLEPKLGSLSRPRVGRDYITHRPLSNKAKKWVKSKAGAIGTDVSGLTQDGKWEIKAGDTGQTIAKSLTGDSSRWTELKAVNPNNMKNAADVKKYGFPVYTYKYNPINIPASWVKPAVVNQPVSVPATQVPAITSASPTLQSQAQTILTQVSTVLAPAGDSAAQAQARAILATWGKTDGANRAGLSDYGGLSEIGATAWSARDVLMAASFELWAQTSVRDGLWNQTLADALHAWAEQKAAQTVTSATTTTTTSAPSAPAVTPAVAVQTPAVSVTPGTASSTSAGGDITLPGITITPGTATASTQTAADEKPTFWQENKKHIIPGGIGALVTFVSRFV